MDQAYATIAEGTNGGAAGTAGNAHEPTAPSEVRPAELEPRVGLGVGVEPARVPTSVSASVPASVPAPSSGSASVSVSAHRESPASAEPSSDLSRDPSAGSAADAPAEASAEAQTHARPRTRTPSSSTEPPSASGPSAAPATAAARDTDPAGSRDAEPAGTDARTPRTAPSASPDPSATDPSTRPAKPARPSGLSNLAKSRCSVAAIAEKARPLRRDAERNRLLILSAARTVFAQRGLEASLDEIAKEAGLGVGTVYRRFPNRDALINALFADMLGGIDEILDEALAMPRAWDGLTHFMSSMLQSQAVDKALRDVVLAGKMHFHEHPDEDVFHERIESALNDLVDRAQRDGDLRPDVSATDIGVLEIAAVGIVEFTASAAPEVWHRYLTIILDGLRARPAGAASALDQPPLDRTQVDACMAGWKYGSREAPRQRPKSG